MRDNPSSPLAQENFFQQLKVLKYLEPKNKESITTLK
jgi:hypothetical protein